MHTIRRMVFVSWAAITISAFAVSTCCGNPKVEYPASIASDVMEGFIKSVNVELKNVGTDPLEIEEVKTSCGCVVTKGYPRLLLPNTSGDIRLQVTGHTGSSTYEQSLIVKTNDPLSPIIGIRLVGNILQSNGFTCSANSVRMTCCVTSKKEPSYDITVTDSKPFQITAANIDSDKILVNRSQTTERSSIIHLRGAESQSPKSIYATLSITLDRGKSEVIEMPVFYEVQPRVSICPSELTIPPIGSTNSFTRFVVTANDGSSIRVSRVIIKGCDGLSYDIHQSGDTTAFVTVKGMPTKMSQIQLQRAIEIYVGDDKEPLTVPIE